MTNKYSVNLTDGEVAWLLQEGGHVPQEGSPLLGFAGNPRGVDRASLRERGLLEGAWGVAFATLMAPDRQVRVVIPGPAETFIQVFYGSRSQPEAGLVGYWLEGDQLHVSFPWEEEDVAAVSTRILLSTIPTPAGAEEFSLGHGGVTALVGAIDVMRDRLFSSLAARTPVVDYRFETSEVNHQLSAGAEHSDARWAVTLLRILAPQGLAIGKELSDGEIEELETAGLVHRTNGGWVPEQAFFTLAGHWRHPLPAIAHEVMEGADGRIDRYDHCISIHGEGPLQLIEYADILSDQPSASVRTVDVADYLQGLVEMMRPAEGLKREQWAYVLDPVEVRGLRHTAVIVGTLQPGMWYRLVSEHGDWVRIADPDSPMEGWASAAHVFRHSDVGSDTGRDVAPQQPQTVERTKPQPAAPPGPESALAWVATHTVPAEGLQAWANPDPAGAVIANLAGRVELRVIEHRADWAQVDAENGWKGWVDGRRLVPVPSTRPHPTPPPKPLDSAAPGAVSAEPDTATGSIGPTVKAQPVPAIAALALLISAFIPWWGDWDIGSFTTSLLSTWDDPYSEGILTIGLAMLLVGVAALATVFWEPASRYRSTVAIIAIGVTVAWLAQALVFLSNGGWGTAIADLFTRFFAWGPWLALTAGVVLLQRRWG